MNDHCYHIVLYCMGLLLLGVVQPAPAQVMERYHEIYPEWPFSIEQATAPGYNKCAVWKTIYVQREGDVPGEPWSQDTVPPHRYRRYDFFSGKPQGVATYTPDNEKIQSMEYFYRNGLLAAIEVLQYDTLQRSSLEYVTKYSYVYPKGTLPTGEAFVRAQTSDEENYADRAVPAQRIREYGPPFQQVRLLDEFDFDTLHQMRRLKTTVVGEGPRMEQRLGWVPNEKRLLTIQYTDTSQGYKVMRDMHRILEDRSTRFDEQGRPLQTQVRNAQGQHLWTIDHHYDEQGRPAKYVHWVRSVPIRQVPPAPTASEKGPRKRKKTTRTDEKPSTERTPTPPAPPAVYKIEYFTYDADGLLEQHITEERGRQTVLQYSYFTE